MRFRSDVENMPTDESELIVKIKKFDKPYYRIVYWNGIYFTDGTNEFDRNEIMFWSYII